LAVLFAATLVRSSLGFGEALLAVPLLSLRIPVAAAAPLAVLLSVLVAAVVVVQDWRDVNRRSAAWLLGATLFGVPVGLWGLTSAPELWVRVGMALLILGFAGCSAWLRARRGDAPAANREGLELPGALAAFGFIAGVLGGAYGMNGPPLVVYGSLRGWRARQFRATLQAYFLPASLAGLVGYGAVGLLTRTVMWYFALSLPGALAAVVIGREMNHRLHLAPDGAAFLRCVDAALIVIGVVLLGQAVWR
jgi:uncharacterized membrane protein YfcA